MTQPSEEAVRVWNEPGNIEWKGAIIYPPESVIQQALDDQVARIVAWLRACELSGAIPDDPAQIVADLADAIERGEWR